jgi:hypothetical protein
MKTNQLCNALVIYQEVLNELLKDFFGKLESSTFTMVAAHPINRSTH